ncbi:MAG: PIN domain-containing protein [Cyclobacteriaceae bacterium]
MKVVVDTNIVFSLILSPQGTISDLIFNSSNAFEFFSPRTIVEELERHQGRISEISQLSVKEIEILQETALGFINVIPFDSISITNWSRASSLLKTIDEFDAPFLALKLELDALLWTGDKKLIRGLTKANINGIVDTAELKKLRWDLDQELDL